MKNFQRPDPAAPKTQSNSNSKIAILGGLVVILGGAVALNWNHFHPRSLEASGNISDLMPTKSGTNSDSADSSEQLLAQLANDPTAKHLHETNTSDTQFAQVPKDPFQIPTAWQAVPAKMPVELSVPNTKQQFTEPHTSIPNSPNAANFKLQAVYHEGNGYKALLNATLVAPGSIIGDCKVIAILPEGVYLQPLNPPGAARFFVSSRHY